MLELHEPDGAFAAIEAYLTDEGFWGRTGVVADLYLGYALGRPLRRTCTASPPETCPPPVAGPFPRPAARLPRPRRDAARPGGRRIRDRRVAPELDRRRLRGGDR